MGIMPYNYGQYGSNSINDSGYDIRRQLETRQAQLDKLNSQDVLSDEQLKRKSDLEKTVSVLQNRLNKQLNKNNSGKNISHSAEDISINSVAKESPVSKKTFAEGTVIAKNPYSNRSYNPNTGSANDTFLKGFFFDARI